MFLPFKSSNVCTEEKSCCNIDDFCAARKLNLVEVLFKYLATSNIKDSFIVKLSQCERSPTIWNILVTSWYFIPFERESFQQCATDVQTKKGFSTKIVRYSKVCNYIIATGCGWRKNLEASLESWQLVCCQNFPFLAPKVMTASFWKVN